MAAPRLKPEHIELIVEMGEKGKSDQAISDRLRERFGVAISPQAISWHRLKHCAEPEKRTEVRPVPTEPLVSRRGNHVVRRFTQAEDAELLRLEAEGLNPSEIGRRLNRKPNSITGRLMILARHEARRERAEARAS